MADSGDCAGNGGGDDGRDDDTPPRNALAVDPSPRPRPVSSGRQQYGDASRGTHHENALWTTHRRNATTAEVE
jgi:hypothetical protein